jgi:predicted amidophosphoribosyltransferase
MAGIAARAAGASVIPALAHLTRDAQRGRTRAQRLDARGRFFCEPHAVAGRRVVLFDDVCTTGATLEDSATALRAAGAGVHGAVVIASA